MVGPKFFCEFHLHWMLDIAAGYHHIKFQGKHMIQTSENSKKPHFETVLGPLEANPGPLFFFFKNLVLPVNRYHGQLQSCAISRKLIIQSREKIVTDVRTHRRTDRQTDDSDFARYCA